MSNLTISLTLGANEADPEPRNKALKSLIISSISVNRAINKISIATIQFIDPSSKLHTAKLALGTKLALNVQQGEAQVSFAGGVVKIDTVVTEDGELVTITLKSAANSLTQHYSMRSFKKSDDSLPFIQNNTSDWDYLVCLAEYHSAFVVHHDNSIAFLTEDSYGSKKYVYTRSLDDFQVDIQKNDNGAVIIERILQAKGQALATLPAIEDPEENDYTSILAPKSKSKIIQIDYTEAAGSNYNEVNFQQNADPQQEMKKSLSRDYVPGAVANKKIDIGFDNTKLLKPSLKPGIEHQQELVTNAREWKIRQSVVSGEMKLINNDLFDTGSFAEDKANAFCLYPGRMMHVGRGLGDLLFFDSKDDKNTALLTDITHKITTDGWSTTLKWGASPKFHVENFPDIQRPPATSMLPHNHGIHIAAVQADSSAKVGTVTASLYDKDAEYVFEKMIIDQGYDYSENDNTDDEQQRWDYPAFEKGELILVAFTASDPVRGIALGGYNIQLKKQQ